MFPYALSHQPATAKSTRKGLRLILLGDSLERVELREKIMHEKIIDDAEIWTSDFVSRKTLVKAIVFDYALYFACGAAVGFFVGVLAR